jgi:hypothetical protein
LNDDHVEKIILHGILNKELWFILFFQPWLLQKCYWIIWGGDLYYNRNRSKNIKGVVVEIIMRSVIKRIGFIITYIKGDFDLAKSKYFSKATYLNCLMYTSNVFYPTKNRKDEEKKKKFINIILGNSAHASNHHLDGIKNLIQFKKSNIKIYCPLSYGSPEYAKKISDIGKNEFGDKFIPLLNFIPKNEYINFLGDIDIGIFPANRQQGMGNIITLLGHGKKVYLNSNLTPYAEFVNKKIKIFNINQIDLKPIAKKDRVNNIALIKNIFNEKNLINQWKDIFCI